MSVSSAFDVIGQNFIYVLLPDGQQAAYEEARVRDLLERQILDPETHFWKDGMTQWLPLRDLPSLKITGVVPPPRPIDYYAMPVAQGQDAAAARPGETTELIPSEEEMQDALDEPMLVENWVIARQYEVEVNPLPVTIVTQLLLLLPIAATTLFLGALVAKLAGWSTPTMDDSYLLGNLIVPLTCAHLIAEISFLVWVYIACLNSGSLARNTTYTPGWSVASFLIPVMNLFRPYQVLQEIWKVSINPNFWPGFRESIFVGVWFFFRLTICVLAVGPFRTPFSDSDVRAVRALGALIYPATLQANLLLIDVTTFVLITVIVRRQLKWVRQSEQMEEESAQVEPA
jgi:hypothetical protein